MESLAENGNGNYAYVDSLDEAEKLFVEDLTATLQAIALDAKIQVDFNPDVVAYYRPIGYENRDVADQDFRNDAVDAGEIGAGHCATALYAVTFRPNADGRIATVQLRWEDPDTHKVTEINGNFNTWDLAQSFKQADQLAAILWQKRFAALQRWHLAATQGHLPAKWDRLEYPLWPAAYGGHTWEDGSGNLEYAAPRPPLETNLEALKEYIAQVFPVGRGRKKISKTNILPKKQLASKRGSL